MNAAIWPPSCLSRFGERVDVAVGNVVEARRRRGEVDLVERLAGRRERAERLAVKPVGGRQDHVTAGPGAGELDRRLDDLGSAVGEGADLQVAGREAGELRGELLGLHRPKRLDHRRKLLRLRRDHRLPQLRRIVAEGERAVLGEEVEILAAFRVEQLEPAAPHDRGIKREGLEQRRPGRIERNARRNLRNRHFHVISAPHSA